MNELATPRPCATRTDAQHDYLANLIGVTVDTSTEGIVGRCRVQAAVITDGGNIVASYLVASNSDAGLYYALARTDKGGVFCPCAGFEHRGKCSHLASCEEEAPAPAVTAPDFAPFKVGDPVVYTSPRDGATVIGQVAAVAGERVTISTASGAYRNFPIAHVTPWQRPAARERVVIGAGQAWEDLFGEAA